jgi:hypothetical protein
MIKDISELHIPPKYFFDGTLPHNSKEATEDYWPPNISFLVQNKLFPPPIGTKTITVPSILSSLKSLEDHLLHFKNFAQIMGNISKVFQLATTTKNFT